MGTHLLRRQGFAGEVVTARCEAFLHKVRVHPQEILHLLPPRATRQTRTEQTDNAVSQYYFRRSDADANNTASDEPVSFQ